MSMWQGHPILAEIRQGFKLRPTQTVDKSKPVIEAEDEELPTIKFERRSPPPVLYYSQPKAQSKSICRVPQEALNIVHTKHRPISPNILNPPPRVPRPPSAPPKNTALLKLGGEIKDRTALLNSIKGGIKLRKAVTVDKSGLILDDEQKALLAARSGTATPGSSLSGSQETLDSQGYSSLTPPSVHSAEDDESFNSRFSDSESESFYQPPPPPPPIQKVNICLANAPPPPPPPPMASTSSFVPKSAPPPPPPLMPMSSSFAAPPPPPPPMPMSSSSRHMETQERSVAFEPEKPTWQPKPKPPVVKEEPKKADAVFDEESLKVSKEKVEAEIKKGTAASRIAAFAKMAESTGGGAVFPKPLGPLIKNPPKRANEAAAVAEKPVEVKSSSSASKKTDSKEKPKSSSSSKQLITKEEVKVHSPKDGKVEIKLAKDAKSSSSSSSTSKSKTSSSEEPSSEAKKSSSSKSSSTTKTGESSDKTSKSSSSAKTGDSTDKPKTSSSSTSKTSSSSSSSKPKTSSSSSSSTTKTSTSSDTKNATKYSVPITVKTDHDPAPPIPKSQPPAVSPSSGKHFKEPTENNNTSLGPYNYKGKSTPSPGSHSSISPNSGSYHTAIGSATSSYSSVPETRGNEKLSPVPSIASSSTSPRSTASGESSKENNHSLESPFATASRFERGATQHSRNFEKIRQSFGAKTTTAENGDANNNGNSLNNGNSESVSSTFLKKKDSSSTMASRSSPSKNTSVPINAPWYNKKDYPEDEKTTTNKNSSKDPETMNPEEMRGNYKFKIDLKKKHPIDIIQR